jgi:hypothetical protein
LKVNREFNLPATIIATLASMPTALLRALFYFPAMV